MILNKIEITNFKCFIEKVFEFDENLNIFNMPNGTGKTSLIQALIFALFNKRPSGLDFDSLRNDLTKNCNIILTFTHNDDIYIIDRKFGKGSSSELYKNGNLISRTITETQNLINEIIPESLAQGLWGANSLALSPILKTEYLFEVLETEFAEPLDIKKKFQDEKTYVQKRLSSMKNLNESITQKDLDTLKLEIQTIEEKIKSKVYVEDSDIIKAKNCQQQYPEYLEVKKQLETMSAEYDIDTARRLQRILRDNNIKTEQDWNKHFNLIERELNAEKSKSNKIHPLMKYPQGVIKQMLADSKKANKCIFCGGPYHEIIIDYNLVDSQKIEYLERQLEDKKYNFGLLVQSIRYYGVKKKLEDLEWINTFDWQNILKKYDEESNRLYIELDKKKEKYELLNKDFQKITELLALRQKYERIKNCINIAQEYIDKAKDYYSNSILLDASKILNSLNSRYDNLKVDDGIYKVKVYTDDFTTFSYLPIMVLSAGEKTIVALSLILAIRNQFLRGIPLIFDEAFSNLDQSNLEAIKNLIRKDYGQWLIVSHDLNMIQE